jgi:hypothetical protein
VHPKEILGVTKLPDDAEVVPTVTGAQSDLTRAVLGGDRRERGSATAWLTPGPESGLTPFGHFGHAACGAVDRPRRAMAVRVADLRNVRQDVRVGFLIVPELAFAHGIIVAEDGATK